MTRDAVTRDAGTPRGAATRGAGTVRGAGTLRLGTRGSALALAQARSVADAYTAATGEPVELVEIVTEADRSSAPVAQMGIGVFVSALREALHAKEIDLAVHSYKDLPTAPADGLEIAAVPTRDDPRDALVTRAELVAAGGGHLAELGPGTRVGTGAPRRVAQLHALGRGLSCVPLRGNVDTRLRKLAAGELDAVVLAAAGLRRLGRADEVTELLDPMLMLPAPAQGALAVECRAADTGLVEQLAGCLDDELSRAAVIAERSLLAALAAGCSAPMGALADIAETDDGSWEIYLRGAVFSLDGQAALRLSATGTLTDAREVGRRLADDLLAAGASDVMRVANVGVPE